MSPSHLISLQFDVPTRSSDLILCDFFLWVYLKAKVNQLLSQILRQIKEKFLEEITGISQNMFLFSREILRKIKENFYDRLHMCIDRDSRHFDEIIFKT